MKSKHTLAEFVTAHARRSAEMDQIERIVARRFGMNAEQLRAASLAKRGKNPKALLKLAKALVKTALADRTPRRPAAPRNALTAPRKGKIF